MLVLGLSGCGPADRPAATGVPAADPEPVPGPAGHVLVERVDPAAGTVTVNAVRLLTGAAARRACAEDGVPGHRGGLCDAYYLRDRSPRLATVPVGRRAVVAVLAAGCRTRPATLRQVAAGLDRHRLYRLDTAGDMVTRLTASCPR